MSYMQLDYITTHTSLSPIRRGFAPGFVNYKKELHALDSQPQVIKFTSCLPMVGGSLRLYSWLLPPLKLVAMIAEILLNVALNTKNQINQTVQCLLKKLYTTIFCSAISQQYMYISFLFINFSDDAQLYELLIIFKNLQFILLFLRVHMNLNISPVQA